jgi:RecB family exonuclease
LVEADEPAPTESEVRERWVRLKQAFAVADHRELRRLLKQIIVEEQRQFDQ